MKRLLGTTAALACLVSAALAQNFFAVMRGNNMALRFDHTTGQYMGSFGAGFWTSVNGAAMGPDGYVYAGVTNPITQVLRFDPYTGQYAGALAGGYGTPIDIAFGPDGNMYMVVFNGTATLILRFDPATGQYLGSLGGGFLSTSFTNGTWIAFDGDTLLATDDAINGVLRFNPITGQYLGSFGAGFVQNPWGITVYEPGKCAVLDNNPGQVVRFDVATGQYQGVFAQGFLNQPTSIETMSDGKIGVFSSLFGAGFLGYSVIRFEPATGKYEGHFGLGFMQQVIGGLVAATPARVSGIIEYQSWDFGTEADLPVTFELRTPGTTDVIETSVATPNPDGTFTFECISRGTFDVTAKTTRHLRDKNVNINIARAGASGLSFSVVPGDCSNDNFINLDDFLILAATYEVSPPLDPNADFNGDNLVNLDDFLILAANYETGGAP